MVTFSAKVSDQGDNLKSIENALTLISFKYLLLGVTQDQRSGKGKLTNSELAFMHEHGEPSVHIPARPFMAPTLRDNSKSIDQALRNAMSYAMAGNIDDVDRQLHALGMFLVNKMRERILAHIPPPLKPKTLRLRRARGNFDDTPLKDTSQLLKSLGYVVKTISSAVKPLQAPPTPTVKQSWFRQIFNKFKFW